MSAHGIDRRDPETITDRAVRSATAALHHDVVLAAKVHNVPDDQKIAGKSQLRNEREFLLKLPFHLGADRRITLLRAKPDNGAQKRIHRVTGRYGELGKFIAKIFERKRESLSQARGVFNCFRQIAKEFAHFAIAFQMPLAVSSEQFPSGIQVRVFANTGENIENLPAVRPGILHAICRQDRQSIGAREIDKFAIDALLSAKEMPLNFHEHILAPESIDQELRAVCRILGSARVSRVGDGVLAITNFSCAIQALKFRFKERLLRRDTESPRRTGICTRDACATQKRDKSSRKLRQLAPSHCALSFLTPQMRLGQ